MPSAQHMELIFKTPKKQLKARSIGNPWLSFGCILQYLDSQHGVVITHKLH